MPAGAQEDSSQRDPIPCSKQHSAPLGWFGCRSYHVFAAGVRDFPAGLLTQAHHHECALARNMKGVVN
jgi:hypothetical protein